MQIKKTILLTVAVLASVASIWGTLHVYASAPPKDAKYMGTKKCRGCHLNEHKTWKKSKHSKTFEALEGPEKKDPDCLKCHTTGFGLPGGFVSEEETPKLKNTGCESCHGPGSEHINAVMDAPETGAWDTKISKIPQNKCVKCHNPHISQKKRVAKLRAKRKKG